ncbi:MAG: hypothetical protein ACI8QF_004784, partial [Limisphaerales bacterium]
MSRRRPSNTAPHDQNTTIQGIIDVRAGGISDGGAQWIE